MHSYPQLDHICSSVEPLPSYHCSLEVSFINKRRYASTLYSAFRLLQNQPVVKTCILLEAEQQQIYSVQFPGTSIPAELLNALPYLTKLQRLSLRSHQREVVVVSGQPLWIGSIEPLLRCMRLKSLDMSYTDMNITLVHILNHLS